MIVSGWKIGAPNIKTGSGYGIRIKLKDRDKYFKQDWDSVKIKIDNHGLFDVNLSISFWGKCSELRSKWIGKWMIEQGIAPWAKNNPPKLKLKSTGVRIFKLSLLC